MSATASATFAAQNPICSGLLEFLECQTTSTTAFYDHRSTSSSPPSSSSWSSSASPVQWSCTAPACPNSTMPAKPAHANYSTITDEEWEEKKVLDRKARTYKTKMCANMATGFCPSGVQCHFAHNSQELRAVVLPPRYKTALCRTYTATGACPYGRKCLYVHRLLFK